MASVYRKGRCIHMAQQSMKSTFDIEVEEMERGINFVELEGSPCYLESEHKQCCCNCVYQKGVYHHCTTSPELREVYGTCICSIQKGWACIMSLSWDDGSEQRIYDNWPRHSIGCEMYTPKKKVQNEPK